MKPIKFSIALGIIGVAIAPANAATTFVLPDIGTFAGYQDSNTTDTFTGDGYIGYYSDSFAHLLGVEPAYSKTGIQVDISGLAGQTIQNAYLSFDLLDGSAGSKNVTITSFDDNGNLGYNFSTPASLGQVSFNTNGHGANLIDITSLVQSRIDSGSNFLGLQLGATNDNDGKYQWTWSDPNDINYIGSDRPKLRLIIDRPSTTVPEPSSIAALALGVSGLAGMVLFKRKRSVNS